MMSADGKSKLISSFESKAFFGDGFMWVFDQDFMRGKSGF